MCFDLHFGKTPLCAPGVCCDLSPPPLLRLLLTESDQLHLVAEPAGSKRKVIAFGGNGSLFDLWFWSLAVAWGLLPAAVRLEDETHVHWLWAESLSDGRLQLGVMRAQTDAPIEEAEALACLRWQEARADYLRRWEAMWDAFLTGNVSDGVRDDEVPEPRRRSPWLVLDVPALEPPPWPMSARVAWFYLLLAHQVRLGGPRGSFVDDPVGWTLSILRELTFSLDAARAGWSALREDDPPGDEARLRLQADDEALCADSHNSCQEGERNLLEVWMQAERAAFAAIAAMVEALLPLLPIALGSHFADARGRRAVLIQSRGRQWLLHWDDGRLTLMDAFCAQWLWPVAHGPTFDRAALDPIDQRRLRFLELEASPCGVVCPVCGYPCMDDDEVEVMSCDICGYTRLWEQTSGYVPALDATEDDEGDPIAHTLRERRAYFVDHGDAWPVDQAFGPKGDEWLQDLRHPERQRLARACMAEWDGWLEQPDPHTKPEEVWRRWNRFRSSLRRVDT